MDSTACAAGAMAVTWLLSSQIDSVVMWIDVCDVMANRYTKCMPLRPSGSQAPRAAASDSAEAGSGVWHCMQGLQAQPCMQALRINLQIKLGGVATCQTSTTLNRPPRARRVPAAADHHACAACRGSPCVPSQVLVHTTLGDLDIELWPKEAPKVQQQRQTASMQAQLAPAGRLRQPGARAVLCVQAVRNFVQLCLEGYYDGAQHCRMAHLREPAQRLELLSLQAASSTASSRTTWWAQPAALLHPACVLQLCPCHTAPPGMPLPRCILPAYCPCHTAPMERRRSHPCCAPPDGVQAQGGDPTGTGSGAPRSGNRRETALGRPPPAMAAGLSPAADLLVPSSPASPSRIGTFTNCYLN